MSPARRKQGRRRGATVLEVAIALVILVVIVLGVFEYGRLVMVKQVMDNAARAGARLAVVSTNTNPPTTTAMIQAQVTSALGGMVQSPTILVYQSDINSGANISNNWNAAPFGSDIAVEIDATYQPIVPTSFGILPNPLPLVSKSVMRSEAN
jgi:Flp pilus assembly protein TadG